MYIFKGKRDLKAYLLSQKEQKRKIGFVPTMGALHAGHLELLKRAEAENEISVCSVFVNPTQFNDKNDFDNYPKTIPQDIEKLLKIKVSALYLPEVKDLYPNGPDHLEVYDFGVLETLGEGAFRPGHFQGVGQVLSRLLNIMEADKMYMGQKDYQQVLITQRLVKLIHSRTEIIRVPIKREPDGLAMSSRNTRLSPEGRKKAPAIYEALEKVVREKKQLPFVQLKKQAIDELKEKDIRVEYLSLANAQDLTPEDDFLDQPQVLLIAAWLDGVRLIDNILMA